MLGGVWRSPPLALNEFCADLSGALDPHSLPKLQALLQPDCIEFRILGAAATAQVTKVVALELLVKHNQVRADRRLTVVWPSYTNALPCISAISCWLVSTAPGISVSIPQ
jgi:hypothetical protein